MNIQNYKPNNVINLNKTILDKEMQSIYKVEVNFFQASDGLDRNLCNKNDYFIIFQVFSEQKQILP